MSARHLQAVRDEFTALDDSLAYIRRIRRPLGDLPVIVITHGLPVTESYPSTCEATSRTHGRRCRRA